MEEEIKTVNLGDDDYPKQLKEIKDAPKVLYYKGSLPQAKEKCFAVVGTRRCSDYGKQIALEIAGDLCKAGLIIVSGLAPGIDTLAHQAVVERKRRTIAVLGTGIDDKSVYPQSNLKLAKKILENSGCLMSEYAPGTRGTNFTFPQRNRIISGLSLGTLVVEAKEKSGSLITAECARKQNRRIFAIPGPVKSSNSFGPHYLIKNGAKLVENVNDILSELNIESIKDTGIGLGLEGQTEEENLILKALQEENLHIDKIIEKTALPAPKVASCLAILEIKCKVRNLGGNVYALKG